MFQVLYTREARDRLDEIARFDAKSARIIFNHIAKLPKNYRSDPFLKGLQLKGLRRNRIGRYRFIYRVLDKENEIHIITIDFRRSVYH